MRKLLAVFLSFVLMIVIYPLSNAEYAFSAEEYSPNELLSIYSFLSQNLYSCIRVPAGIYIVGKDLPAGMYTVLQNNEVKMNSNNDFSHVAVFRNMEEYNKDPDNFFGEDSVAIRSCNTAWNGLSCELTDGMVLVVKLGKAGISKVNNRIFDVFWDQAISKNETEQSEMIVANGKFDPNKYSEAELSSIFRIVSEKVFDCVRVPAGIYIVGKDLPAGMYTVLQNSEVKMNSSNDFSHVAVFRNMEEYNKDPDNFFGEDSMAIRSCNTFWNGFSCELTDGMVLVVKMGKTGISKVNNKIFEVLWETIDSDQGSEQSEEILEITAKEENEANVELQNIFANNENDICAMEFSLQPDSYDGFCLAICADQVNQRSANPDWISDDGKVYYFLMAEEKCRALFQDAIPISLGPNNAVLWLSAGEERSLFVQHDKTLVALIQAKNRGAEDATGLLEYSLKNKIKTNSVVNGDARWSSDGSYLFLNETEKWLGVRMDEDDPYLIDTNTGEIFLVETDGREKRFRHDEEIQYIINGRFSNDGLHFSYCLRKGSSDLGWTHVLKQYNLVTEEIKEIYYSSDTIIDFCEMGSDQWMILDEGAEGKELIRLKITDNVVTEERETIETPVGQVLMLPLSEHEILLVGNNTIGLTSFSFAQWDRKYEELQWYTIPDTLSGQLVETTNLELKSILSKLRSYDISRIKYLNYASSIAKIEGIHYVVMSVQISRIVPNTWDGMYQQLYGLVLLNTQTKTIHPVELWNEACKLGPNQTIYGDTILVDKKQFLPYILTFAETKDKDYFAVKQPEETIETRRYMSSHGIYEYYRNGQGETYIYPLDVKTKNLKISSIIDVFGESFRIETSFDKIEGQEGYLLPEAITKDRYQQFADRLTKKDKKQLSTNYNIYGPENLEQKIDAEEIKALCPKVKTEAMYIIKDNTSKKNLEKVAALFQKAGYTEEDYWIDRAEITESMFDSQYESVEYRLLMNPDNPCTRTQSLQLAGLCDIINSRVYMIFQSGTPDEQKNDMIRKMILDKYTIDGIEYSVDIEEIDNVDESIKMSLAITVSEFE